MDAGELLRSDAPFIADTSAWWRVASLPSELGALLEQALLDDRFWVMPIVRMEVLYSARTAYEYAALERELDALRVLRNDRAVADAAMSAYRELAERGGGYHRVPLTDALIAAAVCRAFRCAEEDSNLHGPCGPPGPQPRNPTVYYVQIVQERPDRPAAGTISTHWTIRMLSRMLARAAHEGARPASAVVIGSRGRAGLRAALLGSVSNAVVHRSRRPVVVVQPPADPSSEDD